MTSLTTEAKAHDLDAEAEEGEQGRLDRLQGSPREPAAPVREGEREECRLRRRHVAVHEQDGDDDEGCRDVPGHRHDQLGGPFVTRHGVAVLPITGGTGGFQGATGTVTIGSGATSAPNIYVVRLSTILSAWTLCNRRLLAGRSSPGSRGWAFSPSSFLATAREAMSGARYRDETATSVERKCDERDRRGSARCRRMRASGRRPRTAATGHGSIRPRHRPGQAQERSSREDQHQGVR